MTYSKIKFSPKINGYLLVSGAETCIFLKFPGSSGDLFLGTYEWSSQKAYLETQYINNQNLRLNKYLGYNYQMVKGIL